MLEALAKWPNGLTKAQLSTLAKVKKGGTFSTYLGDLTREGLVAEDPFGGFVATESGIRLAGVDPIPDDPATVIAHWRGEFRAGARRMLDIVVAVGDAGIDRDRLSFDDDVAKGGTFSTYLGDLARAGLIEETGGVVRLVEWLR